MATTETELLSTFTFDNIPAVEHKVGLLAELRRLLAPAGRFVNLVSSPEIYWHEWASFSTKDFPENRTARSGDTVRIVMLDVEDRQGVLAAVAGMFAAKVIQKRADRAMHTQT